MNPKHSQHTWKPFKRAQASSTWFRGGDHRPCRRLFCNFEPRDSSILSYLYAVPTPTLIDIFHTGVLCTASTSISGAVEIRSLRTRCANRRCAKFVLPVIWSNVVPSRLRGNDSTNQEMGRLCCETPAGESAARDTLRDSFWVVNESQVC